MTSKPILRSLLPSAISTCRSTVVQTFTEGPSSGRQTAQEVLRGLVSAIPAAAITAEAYQQLPNMKLSREAFRAAHEQSRSNKKAIEGNLLAHQVAMASKFWWSLTEVLGNISYAVGDTCEYYRGQVRRDPQITERLYRTLRAPRSGNETTPTTDSSLVENVLILERFLWGSRRFHASGSVNTSDKFLLGGVEFHELIQGHDDLSMLANPSIAAFGNFALSAEPDRGGLSETVGIYCKDEPEGTPRPLSEVVGIETYSPIPYVLFRGVKPEVKKVWNNDPWYQDKLGNYDPYAWPKKVKF